MGGPAIRKEHFDSIKDGPPPRTTTQTQSYNDTFITRQASLADARALASVFVKSFRDEPMMQWTYNYPNNIGTPEREAAEDVAILHRTSGFKRMLCHPEYHYFLLYENASTAPDGESNAATNNMHEKIIGHSGWRIVKPKPTFKDHVRKEANPLVPYYQRLRRLTWTEIWLAMLYRIYDAVTTWLIPNWMYRLYNPALAAAHEQRQRYLALGRMESRNTFPPDVVRRGYWWLSTLGVLPEYTRKGLGGQLLQWGLEKADEDDKDVYLNASADGQALYAKHGFEAVQTHVHFKGERHGNFESVIMRRVRKSER